MTKIPRLPTSFSAIVRLGILFAYLFFPLGSYAQVADLTLTGTNGLTSAMPGDNVTYIIVASNAGPDDEPNGTIDFYIPPAVHAVSWTCVSGDGGVINSAPAGIGRLRVFVALRVGGTVTCTLIGTINQPINWPPFVSTATLTRSPGIDDPNIQNSVSNVTSFSAARTGSADLSITASNGATSVAAARSTTYTITATNAGPDNVVGATVSDIFPLALSTVNWTCESIGGGSCTAMGSGNIQDSVNLPVGASVTYTVSAAVSSTAIGALINSATIVTPLGIFDLNAYNNIATDIDKITPLAEHVVGGDVAGLKTDAIVVLQNNGGDDLRVTSDGTFSFRSSVAEGRTYAVSVLTQPDGQTCSVQGGSGTMGELNVNSVTVNCLENLNISTGSLGNLQVGVVYNHALGASGGVPPYTWAASDMSQPLPAGLSLSSAGVLSGTPTASGSYTSLVTVTDSRGAAKTNMKIISSMGPQIAPAPVSQVFTGSVAVAAAVATPVPTLNTPVPTLNEWALIGLTALLALVGASRMRRRSA